jgi:RNA polymerase sigma-70 factor (ECF subfamily)
MHTNRDSADVLDELLLLRCQSGDATALEQLAVRWNRRFLGLAYRLTGEAEGAKDVVQEAWVAVVHGLARLQDPASFRSWAYQIVHRKAVDRIRRRARRRALGEKLSKEPAPASTAEPDPALIDRVPRLRRAMDQLHPDRRAMLRMFYSDGMTTREIAETLAIPEGTVKTRLFHTRKQLKTLLEESR